MSSARSSCAWVRACAWVPLVSLLAPAVAAAQPAPAAPAAAPAAKPAPPTPSWAKPAAKPAAPPAAPAPAAPAPAAPAPAPAAPKAEPTAAEVSKAKTLFQAGGKAYDAGDFETAIQAFEQAYKIVQREGLLFSLAQAHRRQHTIAGGRRHLDRAVELYRQYVREVKTGGRRAEAAKALGELEAQLAALPASAGAPTPTEAPSADAGTRLFLSSYVEGATISVDGGAPKPSPVSVTVTPGRHTVRVAAPGFKTKDVPVEAIPGELVPETIELDEVPARFSVATDDGALISVDGRAVGEAPLSRPLDLSSGRHFIAVTESGHQTRTEVVDVKRAETRALDMDLPTTTQRDVSWGFLIGGGAFVVGGAVLGGMAFTKQSDAQAILDARAEGAITTTQLEEYESARADRDRLVGGAVGAVGLGALLGLVGVGLFAFDDPEAVMTPDLEAPPDPKKPEEPTMELSFMPSIDGVGAGVRGTF